MDLSEVVMNRRSIRKYKDKEVDDNQINEIIEAGIWAPSAGDLQGWEAVIVKDHQNKVQIAVAAYIQEFIAKAPVIIVICANKARSGAIYGERGRELYCIQDAACAAQNMLLKIHELGLGASWIGAFDENAVAEVLDLPENVRPVALIPLGYPDEKPSPPPRRNIKEFIHHEKF